MPPFGRFEDSYSIVHLPPSSSHSSEPWLPQKLSNMAMVTSGARYMASVHILLIMKSRFSLLVLSVGGVQGSWCIHFYSLCSYCFFPRCRAPRENLDEDALNCTRAFNEALFEETDTDMMWVEYGIVGDLVVHLSFISFGEPVTCSYGPSSHLQTTFPVQIYTNWSHRIFYTNWSKGASRTI